MNTIVTTVADIDYGAGPQTSHTFVDCRYKVDEVGALHIYRGDGNVAAFAPGEWQTVVRGEILSEAGTMEGGR